MVPLTKNMQTLIAKFANQQIISTEQVHACSKPEKTQNQTSRQNTKVELPLSQNSDEHCHYSYLQEYISEQVYSKLLRHIITLQQNYTKTIALWRECSVMWDNLSHQLHSFHMPEAQDYLVHLLFDDIQRGNSQLRHTCCKCLVQILGHQQDSKRREHLASTIKQEFGESESFKNRQTFILFCRASVGQLCRAQFEQLFYPSYIKLAQDKIATVRKQFALSVLDMKPYLDSNPKVMNELFDASVRLKKDKCADVREAMDKTDFDEMKQRKKVLLLMDEGEARNKERQKRLDRRELLDTEEKKKRQDDEQEFEYFSRKPTNKAKLLTKQSTIKPTVKRINSTQNTDKKVDNKRKIISGSSKRNSSALPDLVALHAPMHDPKKKLTAEQSLSYK